MTDGGSTTSLRSLHSGRNNPYLVLENTWQMTKRRNGVPGGGGAANAVDELDQLSIRPVSPISIGSGSSGSCASSDQQRRVETVKRLNLSAICISNILMLEDRHLPSIFIRMYEQCLIINEQSEGDGGDHEENVENKTRLRLLNYLIQRWHETRSRLNFYRDVMRVVGAMAKPILGDHINIAVESTKIDQQHVMSELMRNLRQETNGRTLGEYLESFSQSSAASAAANKFTFNDMALELFTRNEVLAYEQQRCGGNSGGGIGGMIGELVAHPLATYGKRVLFVLLQAMCRLKLNIPTSVSNKLFAPSVPSWVEEDTETGMINCDEATKRRIAEAKDNITRMLLQRRDKLEAQKQAAAEARGEAATAKKSEIETAQYPASSALLSLDGRQHDDKAIAQSPSTTAVSAMTHGEISTIARSADGNSGVFSAIADEDNRSKVDRYLEQTVSSCAADDELCTIDTESFVAYPAASAVVQARSLSALRHMETTVQQVKDADRLQPVVSPPPPPQPATNDEQTRERRPSPKNPSRLVSDYELWQTLRQNFSDQGDVSSNGGPVAKRLRFSSGAHDGGNDYNVDDDYDVDLPITFARSSSSSNDEAPPSSSVRTAADDTTRSNASVNVGASAASTVANIRSNDRDLNFLAHSGYDDELGQQLDNLDSMLVADERSSAAVEGCGVDGKEQRNVIARLNGDGGDNETASAADRRADDNDDDVDQGDDNFDDLL